jgi:hypothetical protein
MRVTSVVRITALAATLLTGAGSHAAAQDASFEVEYAMDAVTLEASRVGSMVRVMIHANGTGTYSCITPACTQGAKGGGEVAMEELHFLLIRPRYPKMVFATNTGVSGDVQVQGRSHGTLMLGTEPPASGVFSGAVRGDGQCSRGTCEALLSFSGTVRESAPDAGAASKSTPILFEGLIGFNLRHTEAGLAIELTSYEMPLPGFFDIFWEIE